MLGSSPGRKRNLTVEKSEYFGLGGFLHRVGGTRCAVAELIRASGNRDQVNPTDYGFVGSHLFLRWAIPVHFFFIFVFSIVQLVDN